jgi:GTPase SAR1 family protein
LDYIQKTENTLGAHLLYIILNIHAASSAGTSTASAPVSSNLPGSSDSLGSLFSTNLSAFIYTPSNLRTDRANVNASWYTVQELYRPAEDYYPVALNENDIASTESGWPTESYIEFSKSKRVLLGFGTIDSQMAGYNFTDDSATVFENGYIQVIERNISATSSGRVTSGCFLRNDTELLRQTNSSWAMDTTLADFDYPTTESSGE